MSLREQLNTIYRTHGELTPKIVVEVARDPSHPLHSRLTWDDHAAAEKCRLIEAGELIRSVRINYTAGEDEERSVRYYHAVSRAERTVYEPIDEIAQDDITREILLRQAERDWRTLRRRYAHLAEFLDLVRREVGAA